MRRALVLNATYEPLSVVPTRRAVCLVLSEKADIVHDDDGLLRSEHIELRTPVVIRLRYMVQEAHTGLVGRATFASATARPTRPVCASCAHPVRRVSWHGW